MIKQYFTVAMLLIGGSLGSFAQNKTGVNTKNPQGAFHVDPKKNNATTGVPTGTQPDDDFIIDANGNVGVGLLAPSTKLHLVSTGTPTAPIPAIRIQDGTQGHNYVLVSDANGNAKWVSHPVMRANVVGSVTSTSFNSNGNAATPYRNTGFKIDLAEGDWIVNAGITFTNINIPAFWQRAYLSSSTSTLQQNGFSHLGVGGNNTCYGGPMFSGAFNIGFLKGSSVINVPVGTTTTIYLLIENKPSSYYRYDSNYLESYFYAVPITKSFTPITP